MGVLKNPKEFVRCPSFSEPNETLNSTYVDDSDIESIATTTNESLINETVSSNTTSQNHNVSINTNNTRQSRTKRSRNGLTPKATYFNKGDMRKIRGGRHARRHENMCFLMSLVEESELNLDEEITYDDIVKPQISAFRRIMSKNESLELWTDFISRSGQEQDEIIDFAEKLINNEQKSRNRKDSNDDNDDSLIDDFVEYYHDREKLNKSEGTCSEDDYEVLNEYLKEKYVNLDKRILICENKFNKIDKNIRNIMKRQVGMDALENYEEKLISTFSMLPDGVYLSKLPTSFDRLIMHGVCQYLDLNSKSFDKDGDRHTQVENNRKTFKLPSLLLSEFIKIRFCSTNVVI